MTISQDHYFLHRNFIIPSIFLFKFSIKLHYFSLMLFISLQEAKYIILQHNNFFQAVLNNFLYLVIPSVIFFKLKHIIRHFQMISVMFAKAVSTHTLLCPCHPVFIDDLIQKSYGFCDA